MVAAGAGDVRAAIDEAALNGFLSSIDEIATPVVVKQFQVRLLRSIASSQLLIESHAVWTSTLCIGFLFELMI